MPPQLIRRSVLLLISMLLLMPALAACGTLGDDEGGDDTQVSLALDWFPWAQHSGLYLALDRGYFEEHGLQVDMHVPANPEDGLKLVASGEEDLAISYQSDVLLAREQGLPVVSVAALIQHPLDSVMSLESSNIERPADLKGKKVGYAGTPSSEAVLRSLLQSDGLTLDDVELVNVGFNLAPALISGRVDAIIGAYWAYESFQIKQESGQEVSVMKLNEWGVPDYYELLLVASEETVAERGEMLTNFIDAMQQGYAAADEDPAAAIDSLLAHNKDAVREVEEASIAILPPLWTSDGEVPFGWQTAEKWQTFADWMKSEDLLAEDVDPMAAFTNQFVEAATEEEE